MKTPFQKPKYTQTPNVIFDLLMRDLSGSELKVLLVIVRKTFGFHEEVAAIGSEKMCSFTGLSKESVRQAIKSLSDKDLIIRVGQYDPASKVHEESQYGLNIEQDDIPTPLPQKLGEGGSPEIGGDLPQKMGYPSPKNLVSEDPYKSIGTKETIKETCKEILPLLPPTGVSLPCSLSPQPSAEVEISFPSPIAPSPVRPVDSPDENVYDSVLMKTDWDFESMVKFVRGRLKQVRKVKISNPDITKAVSALQDYTQGHIEAAVEAFCQETYWREYSTKGGALVKFVRDYSWEPAPMPRREEETGQGAISEAQKVSAEPPSAPAASQGLPERVLEWNALMPESVQVRHWNGNAPKQELAEAERDPEFGERFESACAACREIIEAGKMKGICFDWLFRKSKGKPNWYQVTHGLFAFAMKESTDGSYSRESGPSKVEAIALAMFATPVPK